MSDRSLEFDVAAIGAGIAGLICAQQLRQQGYSAIVLEKSRGVGGRVATRRLYDTCADRGAPFLQPTGALTQQWVQALCQEGIVVPWTDRRYRMEAGNSHPIPSPPHWCSYYAAPTGINAAAKFLARNLEVWRNCRVQSLTPSDNQTWTLGLEVTGEISRPSQIRAKAVVVAIPAPQALMLLKSSDAGVPSEFLDRLSDVEFDPCISVVAGYPPSRQRELVEAEFRARSLSFPPESPLREIVWESSKRKNSQQPVFVFHSSPDFAERYLDATDLEPAGKELCDRAAEWAIPWFDRPEWIQVHRWRYAFCRRPLTEPLLSASTALPIVCAGDWCGTDRIETALQSGLTAAEWVNDRLHRLPVPPQASLWSAIAKG